MLNKPYFYPYFSIPTSFFNVHDLVWPLKITLPFLPLPSPVWHQIVKSLSKLHFQIV